VKIAIPADYREHLAALPADVEPAWYSSLDEAVEAVPGAVAMWYHVDPREAARVLAAGSGLRWLSSVGAGMDRWPLDVLRGRDLVVTNGAGLASIPIAEYTVACMLAAGRGLEAILTANRKGEWDSKGPGDRELNGTKALILGYGHIGQAIAERLRPFGVDVTGVRRRPDGMPGVIGSAQWRDRLQEFDWIILANPLTDETRHQLGGPEVAAMKRTAWIVNIARGGLIDDDALLPALREGRVGGAILDAFSVEPLPADSEYWRLENVIVTPHISWKSSRFKPRAATLFLANLDRFRRGERLTNIVDLDAGY
jgi:phosphoglycerate dehydrogenase-like enzyme